MWDQEKQKRLQQRQHENCNWEEWEKRKSLPTSMKGYYEQDVSDVLLARLYPPTILRLAPETCSSQ